MFQQGGEFGSKGERALAEKPIEGLFAEAIAAEKEAAFFHIPDGKGPHAIEFLHEGIAEFPVTVQEHLGVRVVGLKHAAAGLEFGPEFEVVVDLAVEDDDLLAVRRRHGLGSAGEIDDGKAAMAEMDTVFCIGKKPLRIRPAMSQARGHALQVGPPALADKSGDAAHVRRLSGTGRSSGFREPYRSICPAIRERCAWSFPPAGPSGCRSRRS